MDSLDAHFKMIFTIRPMPRTAHKNLSHVHRSTHIQFDQGSSDIEIKPLYTMAVRSATEGDFDEKSQMSLKEVVLLDPDVGRILFELSGDLEVGEKVAGGEAANAPAQLLGCGKFFVCRGR